MVLINFVVNLDCDSVFTNKYLILSQFERLTKFRYKNTTKISNNVEIAAIMSGKVIIYSSFISKRLCYTLDLVFKHNMGLDYVCCENKSGYIESPLAKFNYSSIRLSDKEVFMPPQGLLSDNGISPTHPNLFTSPMDSPISGAFPHDLLSCIFYLVTRYEEYHDDPKHFDEHGRFIAHFSVAHREGFLDRPIVNLWIELIKDELSLLFPHLVFKKHAYAYLPTYDIDMAWRYKHKGLIRLMGGLARDIAQGNSTK